MCPLTTGRPHHEPSADAGRAPGIPESERPRRRHRTRGKAARLQAGQMRNGFPAVHITLGGRDRTGTLRTITAHCPVCHGTGTRRSTRRLSRTVNA